MVMNTPLRPIITCMERYILYETSSYYYIVGCDAMETYFRVLKLNRTVVKPRSLDEVLTEDPIVYTKDDLRLVLEMIHEGNKTSGGLSRVTVAYGIVGFVRFLDCYYVTLITQKKKVGCVGSNFIYAIKAAEVFAIRPQENSKDELSITKMWRSVNKKLTKTNTDQAESRYMGLFQFIDISKDFFFSYTYDLTHSLQHNYIMSGTNTFPPPPFKEMYEWNKYQTDEIRACLGDVSASLWSLPIIHGSFQQRRFSMFGRTLDLVLIARRSRHYAGTRYLKRGVSVHGKVANDCEMEQIVQLDSGLQATFASYVQMRGSIPTYWYQETSVTNPKPPILVDRFDPNYLATQEHFADLIRRYSLPVIVLDLVKQHERRKRECIVGKDFRQAIDVINISMPPEQQIRYIALDFSRMSKSKGAAPGRDSKGAATGKEWSRIESSLGKEVEQSMRRAESGPMMSAPNDNRDSEGEEPPVKDQQTGGEALVGRVDVLRELEEISSWSLQETAIFSSTIKHRGRLSEIMPERHLDRAAELGYIEQRGVLRTNCIDCLDRTNVAQFAMGVRFLTTALTALGVLDSHTLEPSNAMLLGLMDMYSDMGDRLALQYGGSEAHKKVSKGAGKTKHGEFLTSIKRYYSNSFTDRVKQDAMNLFLGYFQPSVHEYALWDLETDYFLHNRLLHPPRPDTDLILFSSCRGEHMSESDTEDAPRRSSLGDRPTIEEIIYSGCLQRPPPEDSDDMDDIDWSKVSRKYFIKHPEDANKIERNIASKERIKRRLSEKKELVKAAEELWWRKALMDFDSERMWMRLPPKKDGMSTLSYYETTHTPLKLTSFDDELSQEFQYPMDATVFAAPKPEAVGYWTRGRDVGKMTIQEGREDDGDDEEGQMEAEGEGRRIDQVEFDLFSFARSLGQRARSLVGDLLKPVESEGAVLKSSLSDSDLKRERSPMTWASRANDAGGLQARPSDECAERLYTRYCEDGIHPESYISESRCMSEKDFEHALAGVMVDDNDVQAMEQLAKDSYISDTVSSGINFVWCEIFYYLSTL